MSTTIKRIALVAVAALGLGVLSVAPSQAADNALLKFATGDGTAAAPYSTGNGVAGAFNYVTVTADTWSATSGNDYIVTTDSTFGATTGSSVISTDKKSLISAANGNSIQVMTPAVGTVTVSYWKRTSGVLAAAAAETVVITVNAKAQAGTFSAANSYAYIVSGETNSVVAPTADATVTGLATANADTATASIQILLKDALKAAYQDTVTATVIAGGANVRVIPVTDSTTSTNLRTDVTPGTFSASALTSSAGGAVVFVHANGTSGPAKIKLTLSDGTVLGEKTVTFSSTTVATLTPTVVYANVPAGSTLAGAITVIAKDQQGYVIPNAPISVTSGDTTKIASVSTVSTDADGKASFTVGGVAATSGKVTLTFKSGVATTTADVTVSGVKATKITITPSATSAEAGSKITYTMTLADANGPIADGTYVGTFVGDPVTSNGGTGAFATDTVTVLAGKATSSIFLPFVSGKYTSTWTTVAANSNLDSTIAATELPVVSVDVTNAGVDLATDAANEAAQAASDATDAALAAADAADLATGKAQEALDAVNDLANTVATLIADLKSQIKTLSNLVTKIAKKVKA